MRKWLDLFEDARNATDFAEWFAGSKVVDRFGKPLRCFHGSMGDIDEFFTGSHFGDIEAANVRLQVKAELGRDFRRSNDGIVYPVYLSIKKPLRVIDDGGLRDGYDLTDAAFEVEAIDQTQHRQITDTGSPGIAKRRLFDILSREGYDGMVYENTCEGIGDSWLVFRADQVRFAMIGPSD